MNKIKFDVRSPIALCISRWLTFKVYQLMNWNHGKWLSRVYPHFIRRSPDKMANESIIKTTLRIIYSRHKWKSVAGRIGGARGKFCCEFILVRPWRGIDERLFKVSQRCTKSSGSLTSQIRWGMTGVVMSAYLSRCIFQVSIKNHSPLPLSISFSEWGHLKNIK